MKTSEIHPHPGDVIYVTHKWHGIPYDHYGVFIGDDCGLVNQVIHYRGKNKEISLIKADIIQTSLQDFLNGGILQIQDHNFFGEEYPPYSAEKIIERAKDKLGRGKGIYTPWSNNCEHFANDCRYGRHISSQVEKVVKSLKKAGKRVVIGTIIAVGSKKGYDWYSDKKDQT